ncbi:hypothetical protein Amet_0729 [Alkaliphilus metalliredigens QYMF]|uniref:Uncharacterized protein n=1 Tax=Alkaliphilus metalliredigens (strain QYMF) TaxID=293826 RepID=A6TL86_ALKMQ|nr:DUF6470 family protein [Alkaliphilus metalliredigens]ABR46954.1 hypothetical protein Amet_0729 [Alkaliphilus metalliredigens QYMF]
MNLRIDMQNAQIGIQQQMGQLNIQQNHFPMTLQQTEPKLSLQTADAELTIDQQRCFAEVGLKNDRQLTATYAQKGNRTAQQAIARIAQEGKQMANIQNGKVIARQAKQSQGTQQRQLNYDMAPKSRPDINVTPKEVQINFQKGEVSVNVQNPGAQIDYQQGDLQVYLKQKDFINIEYIGQNLNTLGG